MFTTISQSLQTIHLKHKLCIKNVTSLETLMNPPAISLEEKKDAKNQFESSSHLDSIEDVFEDSIHNIHTVDSILMKGTYAVEDPGLEISKEFRTLLKEIIVLFKAQKNIDSANVCNLFIKNSIHNDKLQSDIIILFFSLKEIFYEILNAVERISSISKASLRISVFKSLIRKTEDLSEKLIELEYLISIFEPTSDTSQYFFADPADVNPDFEIFKKQMCSNLDRLKSSIENFLDKNLKPECSFSAEEFETSNSSHYTLLTKVNAPKIIEEQNSTSFKTRISKIWREIVNSFK